MTPDENILLQKLDEFIRKYYKNQLIKGLLYAAGLLLLFYLSVSVLEYFAEFNSYIRAFLFYSFLGSSLFVLGKYIAIPLLKLNSFGAIISYQQAAKIIGNHFSNVQDKVLNVLQLQSETNQHASLELLQASIHQKTMELKPVPFTAAIDLSENRKHIKYALIPFVLLLAILIVNKKILGTGTTRLIHYNTYFEKEAPFQFNIENKNLQAIQQQDFELNVKINGSEIPSEVFVLINGNEFKLDKQKEIHRYVFKNVQQNIDFQLSGGGFRSKIYTLTVLPKPTLLGFEASLKYPAYLHKKGETINNTGDMLVPQGTQITWTFNTKNSDGIWLRFMDSSINLKPQAENKFLFSKRFMQSAMYNISTHNKMVPQSDSIPYTINVIPDTYPTIEMHEKTDSLRTDVIYFSGNIKDDYGFSRFDFKYKIYTAKESKNEEEQHYSMPLQVNQSTQPFVHYIDIAKMNLQPGDKVEYYFEIWDNDGVHGAKSSKTNIAVFKAPTLEDLEKQNEQNNHQLEKDLEESLKKSKELQKEIADLNKKILEKKQLTYDEKKQLEKLMKNQKELEKKINELNQKNEQNNQEQNKYQQPNENLLEKQQQLEKLLNEIMTPEMKKAFDELQKLMDKMDKNKVQETLEKMDLQNKDIEKELDRTLEQFKQMQVQEKLEKTADKLKELAQKQEQLSQETENKKNNSEKTKDNNKNDNPKNENNKANDKKKEDTKSDNKNAEQKNGENKEDKNKTALEKQNELNKSFEDIKKDIQKMQELNQSLENQLPLPDTKQQEQNASQQQQNATEQLQKNNQKGASKPQQQAAEQMQQMSDKMQQAAEQMQEEQEGEDTEALRQIMKNLLYVSFSLEDLNNNIKKTKTNDPRYTSLAQTQKKLQDDSKMIEDSLFALSKRNPKVSAHINREISAVKMNMKKSLSALEERNSGEAQIRTRSAMTSVNNLALMLNESLEQMQAQMKAQKNQKSGGSNSCKKPGKGQKPSNNSSPSMSSMRKMQEQLNKQIEQMKKMLEQGQQQGGKKPGDKPGQPNGQGGNPYGNTPGMSESLAKMAAEQEALRRSMQEALQKMKKENGGSQPGGDILNKMEETETDLVNKRITQETIKRQQEIMTKLLESEKAEREQEQDEKRKSNEAKNQDYTNPAVFLEYQKIKEKETELLKTIPPDMTPYYRQKVNEYFNTIEK
ncbi:MAG: hypothetical protein JST67_07810 [Bacteroidetes bacterium]|nr:hypothetical protein [Bacteroidota bacterium]